MDGYGRELGLGDGDDKIMCDKIMRPEEFTTETRRTRAGVQLLPVRDGWGRKAGLAEK